jgi:hypothetical protein
LHHLDEKQKVMKKLRAKREGKLAENATLMETIGQLRGSVEERNKIQEIKRMLGWILNGSYAETDADPAGRA